MRAASRKALSRAFFQGSFRGNLRDWWKKTRREWSAPNRPQLSRRTSAADLSVRVPKKAAWRSRPSAVHSTNRICAMSSGRNYTISCICAAVTRPPQRDGPLVGRLVNEHRDVRSGPSFSLTWRRTCVVNPARTLAALCPGGSRREAHRRPSRRASRPVDGAFA